MRQRAIAVFVILGALLFAHAGALHSGFHYDDIHSVVENPKLRSLISPTTFFTDPTTFSARPERAMFRPLVVLSYAVTYAVADLAPWAHLFVNLLAHVVGVAAVCALALALMLPWTAAAGAAVLFAVHPVNSEVVNYVSSRSESFAAGGMLLALWGYLRWRAGADIRWYVLSLIAFGLALTSKATAVALPVMLVALEALLPATSLSSPRRRALVLLPFLVAGGAHLWIVAGFAARSLGHPVRPLLEQIWTQLKAASYYLHLLVVPTRLSVEHDFAVAHTPANVVVLLSAALVVSVMALIWRLASRRNRLLLCWAVLAVVPASIVPLNVLVNEHRLYLASAFLFIVLSAALWSHMRRTLVRRAAAVLLIALLAILSHQRSRVWDTEHSLWGDAVAHSPYAYRAHMHFGGALEAEGDIVGALDRYRRAVELQPDVPETHYNLGNALRLTGHISQARQSWERSLQQDPTFLESLLNLAAFHQQAGDWEQTWEFLRRAEAAYPQSAEVWRRKGLALRLNGAGAQAETAFLHALELDPDWVETHFSIGNLYHNEGRLGDAARHYTIALQLRPAHHGAAYNLADLRLREGDAEAAERICRSTLRLDALRHTSGQSKLFYLLARALDAQGRSADALINYGVFLHAGNGPASVLTEVQSRMEQLKASNR